MKHHHIGSLAVVAAMLPLTFAVAQQTDLSSINAGYKDPNLQVEVWVDRLESEGREVFDFREEIIASTGLEPGQDVADVGAGTGLFQPLLAAAVGSEGTVYAVDIVPRFIEHIRTQAAERNLTQITAILGDDRSTGLPASSVDVAFVCDTYHHFEDYEAMLASIHEALRPGGKLVIVDYERREPRLDHIRADKDQFTAEIEANGFRFTEEIFIDGMEQSFIRHFERM
ncbi:class I SAM-dependent methyltransferase [Candidatus Rariloculus sp.]|uniref:class I SAM-dependent methyltransferase n=1 Tax=Candidatus Rariloculus sp. TaxID=3101265 RepID=UPI003D0B5506